MNKQEWLTITTNNASINEIAKRSDIPVSTLWRRSRDDFAFTSDEIIKIARAYGANPLDALVIFGYLRQEERSTSSIPEEAALKTIGKEKLLDEVSRRMAY